MSGVAVGLALLSIAGLCYCKWVLAELRDQRIAEQVGLRILKGRYARVCAELAHNQKVLDAAREEIAHLRFKSGAPTD